MRKEGCRVRATSGALYHPPSQSWELLKDAKGLKWELGHSVSYCCSATKRQKRDGNLSEACGTHGHHIK